MDSAKNKKLFPDLEKLSPAYVPASKPKRFSMPPAFWDALERDPDLKAEFDRRVEKRARELVDAESGPQKLAIFESARAQGLVEGLAEGRAQSEVVCRELAKAAKRFAEDREKLLHAHEASWCQAISHLMRRFLVPLTPERLKGLRGWLEDSVGDLTRHTKVRVALSPGVLDKVRSAPLDLAENWEWVEDRALAETDLRIELQGGGVFFSPQAQWEKFEAKLNEFLGADASTT